MDWIIAVASFVIAFAVGWYWQQRRINRAREAELQAQRDADDRAEHVRQVRKVVAVDAAQRRARGERGIH